MLDVILSGFSFSGSEESGLSTSVCGFSETCVVSTFSMLSDDMAVPAVIEMEEDKKHKLEQGGRKKTVEEQKLQELLGSQNLKCSCR